MTALPGRPWAKHMGDCLTCGKKRWPDRKAAKRAAKAMYPGHVLRAYRCAGAWHIGHLPAPVRTGDMAATDLTTTR